MITLSIDTATSLCSAGILRQSQCLSERSVASERSHNAVLPALIEDVVKDAGIRLKEISLIAVSIGPGSFTGLRVGLSYTKGLAMGLGIPVVPVGTLDALALNLLDRIEHQTRIFDDTVMLCPITTARKGEVFGRIYTASHSKCQPTGDIFAGNCSDIQEHVQDGTWIGGEGLKTLAEALDHRFNERYNVVTDLDVSAAKVGLLGLEKHLASPVDSKKLLEMEPLYMKEFTIRKRVSTRT